MRKTAEIAVYLTFQDLKARGIAFTRLHLRRLASQGKFPLARQLCQDVSQRSRPRSTRGAGRDPPPSCRPRSRGGDEQEEGRHPGG
jgi:hypothetical protein